MAHMPGIQASPGSGQAQILLVEDDAELAAEICADLASRGYRVAHVLEGNQGLAKAKEGGFDLVIIDRLLPGTDGLAIVQRLRAAGMSTPALVISALSGVDERVQGLKAGGDDYLTKPLALAELHARVEALLRRPMQSLETVIRIGPLALDRLERKAWREQRPIELLPTEFKILEFIMRRAGQVITREMLLEGVWHYRFLPHNNVVDVHVGKLRRKIDGPGEAPMIHSIRGAGFMLRDPS
jgi:two-component system, OmpR family, response regulator